ncbi:hypothetical protein J4405_03085 [Candidatus Woesearchaeota archaeon]|nr:hypothetical protein [Candidatus Woesearchaeota archaeon]
MAVPTRRDMMYSNMMARSKARAKEVKEEDKPKDEQDVKSLIELWKKNKEKK